VLPNFIMDKKVANTISKAIPQALYESHAIASIRNIAPPHEPGWPHTPSIRRTWP